MVTNEGGVRYIGGLAVKLGQNLLTGQVTMKAQVKRKAHIPLPTRKREGGSGHPVAMPPQQKSDAGMAVQGLPVQAQRLTIGEPNDRYEQEADRVAAEVVQGLQEPVPEGAVQREVVPSLRDRAFSPVRRVGGVVSGEATPEFERGLRAARGGGQRLDEGFRARVEPLMGQDFGGVRVHTDGAADTLSRSIQAKAFTAGRDVFFAKGEYEPGSREGQGLLAHELTHVGQQGSQILQRGIEKRKKQNYSFRNSTRLNGLNKNLGSLRHSFNTRRQKQQTKETQSILNNIPISYKYYDVPLKTINNDKIWDGDRTSLRFTEATTNAVYQAANSEQDNQNGRILYKSIIDAGNNTRMLPRKRDAQSGEDYATIDHRIDWATLQAQLDTQEVEVCNPTNETNKVFVKAILLKTAMDEYNNTDNLQLMSNTYNSSKSGKKGVDTYSPQWL